VGTLIWFGDVVFNITPMAPLFVSQVVELEEEPAEPSSAGLLESFLLIVLPLEGLPSFCWEAFHKVEPSNDMLLPYHLL
jgi:hypothetical protein